MLFTRLKRFMIGDPLPNQIAAHEKIPKWKALAVLSSDALSSVAYATEEMLIPLAAVSAMAMSWSMPIAMAIGLLLIIVAASYRQTIEAYPGGGGAYMVAKENIGTYPGLIAGSSLLIDYVLTVAVSVAAGTAAITSAIPILHDHRVGVALFMVLLVMILNLRGIRESATIFAFPTYIFVGTIGALLVGGAWKAATGNVPAVHPIVHEAYPDVALFLVLRAFSSGCSALTGIEAISNGVTIFQPPATRNAKITLTWMAVLLACMFLGITLLAHLYGIVPVEGQTAVSQLARIVFGENIFYYVVQGATALILVLAANTAFNGFPMLASLLAKDRFLPRQLASLGDKLVFSNGILGLGIAASVLIWIFEGDTHALIPLYAVGVFLSFTLSQFGMVLHSRRERQSGWRKSIVLNALGGATTAVVLAVISITKFMHGAWVVLLLIPMMVFMFTRIQKHYLTVGKELSLVGVSAPPRLEKLKHTVIIPISGIHRGVIDALRYAISISDDVRACYVELDPVATENVQREWNKWAHEVPFVVLKSPYRSVITPLLEYINDVEQITHDELITVIIPEFVTAKLWHRFLHNQTALLIRAALAFKKNKVVTSVRYHLRET